MLKYDILDEELTAALKNELPNGIETVFISSVAGIGLNELKDLIWTEVNKESNKIIEISHRPMEIVPLSEQDFDDDDFDDDEDDEWMDDDDDDEDISKYKGIGWDDL